MMDNVFLTLKKHTSGRVNKKDVFGMEDLMLWDVYHTKVMKTKHEDLDFQTVQSFVFLLTCNSASEDAIS